MSSSNIKAIDKASVHRITSGQVVVDLQTAVKELVENSLDAGATNIEIRFRNYGLNSVEVIDNGSGIAEEDFESIALKHHTSKLESYEGLTTVNTFGFRGEALSSLCALCEKVSVTTATKETSPKGTCLEMLKTGEVGTRSIVARQKGTTVSLLNPFAPLPVRRKEFERNLKREFGKALSLLQAYALVPCSSEAAVRLSVANFSEKGQKSIQLQTSGTHSIKASVNALWDPKALDNVIELDIAFDVEVEKSVARRLQILNHNLPESTTIQVKGLVSKFAVGCGRTNADRQFFYVNGRPCNMPKVQKAFNEVYRTFNMNQSPFVVANFVIPTASCDINVSPDKRTILVHNEGNLIASLKAALESHFSPARSTFDLSESQNLTQSVLNPVVVARRRSEHSEPQAPISDVEETGDAVPATASKSPGTSRQAAADIPPSGSKSKKRFTTDEPTRILSKRPNPQNMEVGQPEAPSTVQTASPSSVSAATSQALDLVIDTTKSKWSVASTPVRGQQRTSTPTDHSSSQTVLTSPNPPSPSELKGNDSPASKKRRPSHELDALSYATQEIGSCSGNEILRNGPPPRKKRMVTKDAPAMNLASFAMTGSQVVLPSPGPPQKDFEDVEPSSPTSSPTSPSEHRSEAQSSDEDELVPLRRRPLKYHLKSQENVKSVPPGTIAVPSSCGEEVSSSDALAENESPPTEIVRHHDVAADISVRFDLYRIVSSWKRPLDPTTRPGHIPEHKQNDSGAKVPSDAGVQNSENNEKAAAALSRIIDKSDFASMDIIGQFNLGFIICRRRKSVAKRSTGMDDLFIVDQHAADEKYNFETLQLTTKIQSQKLLRARTLELTAADELVASENLQILQTNGFEVHMAPDGEVRGSRLQLIAQPVSKNTVFDMKDLEELVHLLRDSPTGTMVRCSKARAMFASRACRKSVMVGMALNNTQMTTVVRHMGTIDQPWNCPHGRPTMRHLADIASLGSPLKDRVVDWAAFN